MFSRLVVCTNYKYMIIFTDQIKIFFTLKICEKLTTKFEKFTQIWKMFKNFEIYTYYYLI